MPSLETNSVSGFRSSSLVILDSGCVRKTCGSFWKIAATDDHRHVVGDRVERLSVFAVMKKSILPAISSMRLFSFGPPGTMVTSSPYFL